MTKEKKNVPALRFPEFEDEWEEKKLGEKLEDTSIRNNNEIPLYSLTVERGLTKKTERYNRDFLVKNKENFKVVNHLNIVYNPMNITLGAIDLHSDESKVSVSGYYNVLKIIDNSNPKFLIELLRTHKSILSYKKVATGTLIEKQRVHFSEFKMMKKYFPSDKEQQKIGDFFSKLDRQIELEEEKLALLEEQKKGYIQKIFSQELRFKDENGNDYPEWEEKKLSYLGSYSKSYSFSRDVEGEGKVHHIHYGDIHSKLSSKISDINLLPTIKESKDFEFLQKGDIIFADASEDYKDLGKAIMVDIDEDNIIAGLHTHVFRPNLQVVSEFLMYYTKTLNYFKFIKRQGTGISVLGISKKNLSNFILGLPERREQQKIGDFFSKLDQQIELQGQKIESLKQRKKGLLQKMFV